MSDHTPHLPDTAQSADRFWNERYASADRIWSGSVNPVLAREVSAEPSAQPDGSRRTALDLGCGEGADAVWLAQQGWQVTAVDIAETALARGRAAAEAAGVGEHIEWQRHDLAQTFPVGRFDLVSAQFLQSPIDFPREDILRRAPGAVASGGLLLIVGHAEFPPGVEHPGMHLPDATEVRESLQISDSEWQTVIEANEERIARTPDGEGRLVDAVLMLRRR